MGDRPFRQPPAASAHASPDLPPLHAVLHRDHRSARSTVLPPKSCDFADVYSPTHSSYMPLPCPPASLDAQARLCFALSCSRWASRWAGSGASSPLRVSRGSSSCRLASRSSDAAASRGAASPRSASASLTLCAKNYEASLACPASHALGRLSFPSRPCSSRLSQ